ncbi:uncharacterized protein N7483_009450 [Penicillium malachiteum]|uniref:uncharacterized protein n=1 Tax=Penicillium malachiteum TaxID=1324776 RepID=UPI00254915AB|nr:uncharacterized protein N7483_009450 [Penicillium malachiteum]KAJ5721516.1 hypothetical protein N7483_009450 [Penicillium malachiteum]
MFPEFLNISTNENVVLAYQGLNIYGGIVLRTLDAWDPCHWKKWLAQVKSTAQICDVWHLVDPFKTEHEVAEKLIQKPTPPEPLSGDEVNIDFKYVIWKSKFRVYKARYREWEDQHIGIMAVNIYITQHLDIRLLVQMSDELKDPDNSSFEPYGKLTYLSGRFDHTGVSSIESMLKWRRIQMVPPSRGVDVLKWLTEWDIARLNAIATGMETDSNHVICFVGVAQSILPAWGKRKMAELARGTSKRTRIEDVMADFRNAVKSRS